MLPAMRRRGAEGWPDPRSAGRRRLRRGHPSPMTAAVPFRPMAFLRSLWQKSGRFRSRSLLLIAGTGGGQLIHILAAPLLTRLFDPGAFGIFALYLSMSTILAVVACLRYDGALMITRKPAETANLAALCVAVSFAFCSLAFAGALLLLRMPVNLPGQISRMGWSLCLVPLAVFLLSLQNVCKMWHIRLDRFRSVSCSSLLQSTGDNSTKAACGLSGRTEPLGLILGHLAGAAIGAGYLFSRVSAQGAAVGWMRHIRLQRIRAAGRRYRTFPLYNSWSSLINVVSIQLPVLMMGWLFGVEAAGFYLLAHRVLKLPLRVMGLAVSDALFKEVADRRRETRPIFPFLLKVLLLLGAFLSVPLTLLLFGGGLLFKTAFGSTWTTAGLYATIMVPWIAMQFLSSAISSVFSVLERNRLLSGLQVMLLGCTIVPFLLAEGFGRSEVQTMTLLSIFSSFGYLGYGLAGVWICRSHDRSIAAATGEDRDSVRVAS